MVYFVGLKRNFRDSRVEMGPLWHLSGRRLRPDFFQKGNWRKTKTALNIQYLRSQKIYAAKKDPIPKFLIHKAVLLKRLLPNFAFC